MVQAGPLLLTYGLCGTCNHRTGLAHLDPQSPR
jgi:hypothetical protein